MIARNHHYVPQCYLKGFSYTQNRQSKVFTLDAIEKSSFRALTRNVAAERDFNRVDIEGHAPDALEASYGKFEGELAPALSRIKQAGNLDDEKDRIILLNLIALLAVRNPRHRERSADFQEEIMKMMLQMTFATQERWESQRKAMLKKGYLTGQETQTYEELKKFVDENEYAINIPRETHIQHEIYGFDAVLRCLIDRKWTVVASCPQTTGFITSDHPVCLRHSEKTQNPQLFPPGFGMTKTDVVFPISKDLLTFGRFEGEPDKWKGWEGSNAYFNSVIASFAKRQIYAADNNFLYLAPDQTIKVGIELFNEPFFKRPRKSKSG